MSSGSWTAPVDVECPRPREPSTHATHLRGPLGQSVQDRNGLIVSSALSVRAAELDEEHPGHDEHNPGHHGAGQWLTEEEP